MKVIGDRFLLFAQFFEDNWPDILGDAGLHTIVVLSFYFALPSHLKWVTLVVLLTIGRSVYKYIKEWGASEARLKLRLIPENPRVLIEILLRSIFENLGLSDDERISIYRVAGGKAQLLSRYTSASGKRNQQGRQSYPIDQGVIGKAFENGSCVSEPFTDYYQNPETYYKQQNKYGLSNETVNGLTMYSRRIGATTANIDGDNAIIVVESMDPEYDCESAMNRIIDDYDGILEVAYHDYLSMSFDEVQEIISE